jgi:methylmalonyl-CoA mutase, N-terminal domain
MQEEIHRAAYEFQIAVERADKTIVGVNRFTAEEPKAELSQPDFSGLEKSQRQQLAALKASRDPAVVAVRLHAIRAAARGTDNLMPHIIDAVKAMVTLGEISDALRAEWGVYRPV